MTVARPLLTALLAATVTVAVAGCGGGEDAPAPPAPAGDRATDAAPPFHDATAEAGLDFVHFNGMSGEYYYSEMMGSGAALLDHDGDGDLDLLLVQGTMLDPAKTPAEATFPPPDSMLPLVSRLYRNLLVESGDLRFEDVTAGAGLGGAVGYGMGVAVGDVNGDGHPDLYLTYHGPNRLYLNAGDGTFRPAPAGGAAADPGWSTSASFFDADGDGDLDLYVVDYVDFSVANHKLCRDLTGAADYCGPLTYPGQQDRFYLNRGDGTFDDRTAAAGIDGHPGAGLGVVAADLDGDGRDDLYVANDGAPNFLWRNRGPGADGVPRFEETGLRSGAALNRDGRAEAGMGVVAGDVDGDGDDDLAVTHLALETNTLYAALGGGAFEDLSAASGFGPPSWPLTAFGAAWIDVDNDGRLDFAAVAGGVKVIPELAAEDDPHPLHQPNQLLRNVTAPGGPPRFEELPGGPPFERSEVSRGLAAGDVDGDGDVDLVVSNNAGPARLLLNRAADGRPWIGLRLVHGTPPRDALGAVATVLHPDGRRLRRRVRTDGSYLSANDPRLVVGLGEIGEQRVDVAVTWPGGGGERFPALAVGHFHTLTAGEGEAP